MADRYFLAGRRRIVFSGLVSGSLSTGDGQGAFLVPFAEGRVIGAGFALDVGGTADGPTTVMINRVRDESDTEVLSAVMSIAHDATTVSTQVGEDDLASTPFLIQQGDIVRIDVDGASTGAAGLAWFVVVHIDKE